MPKYKDVSWVDQNGARSDWRRIAVEDVPGAINQLKESKVQHIFVTIQTFSMPTNQDGEEFIAPFFIDLDGDKDVGLAKQDAEKVVDYLVSKHGVNPYSIELHFSGKKGFHILVPRQMFGGLPSNNLHKVWRGIAKNIMAQLGIKSVREGGTFDETIYTKRRMWRVENTIHGGSGAYKIPLDPKELRSLSMADILTLSNKPQTSYREEYDSGPIDSLAVLYNTAKDNTEFNEDFSRFKKVDCIFEDHPLCIKHLLENGVTQLGFTNATMFRLAAYFKSQDCVMPDTIELLSGWIENIQAQYTHDLTRHGQVNIAKLKKDVIQVCRSVYGGGQYGFSCSGIKQLPGVEGLCTPECKKMLENVVQVTLFDAMQARNLGTKLHVKAEVVGRRDIPYVVPKVVKASCKSADKIKTECNSCPLFECRDGVTFDIGARSHGILEFLMPSNTHLIGKIARVCNLPDRKSSCNLWEYQVQYADMEVLYLSPLISNAFATSDQYTRQVVYYLGKGIELNESYELIGYIHIHDVNNSVQLVIEEAKPMADSLKTFKFTEKMSIQSKIFEPNESETYYAKHNHIASTLNQSVIRLWGRELAIRCVDLVYHSVNRIKFQRQIISGRLDILMLGDSGQGKSTMAEALMRHFDLGMKVSGEAAGRTGLLYTIPTKENTPAYIIWGVIPRYTRRLVFIDELKGLLKSGDFGELTEVRSSGQVVVAKTVFGKAQAETRLISMTNAVGKMTLGTYNYPVLALLDLFEDREDIRRFTFAVSVMSDEIDDAIINLDINKLKQTSNPYISEICHNHVLRAWSLEPEHIHFADGIEAMALKLAYSLCQQYVPTIPLVEPGDFRHKLVRVAAAIAARLNSYENNHLIIKKEAITYAHDFFHELYTAKSMQYRAYSEAHSTFALDNDGMVSLAKELTTRWPQEWEFICNWAMVQEYIKPKDLSIAGQLDSKEVKECLQWLSAGNLLETTSRGHFTKTENGVRFLQHLMPGKFDSTYQTAEEVLDGEKDSNPGDKF